MRLPEEARKLLQREAKNLIVLRKRIRMYMQGAVAGGALQIFRMKKELEDFLTQEILATKSATRKDRIELIKNEIANISVPEYTQNDLISAHLAASSFSTAWASAQIANVPFNWDPRLRRIVATETSRSYSAVLGEVARDRKLIRRWVSILDSKTCPRCRDLDGIETQPGEPFEGGLEPGFLHPNCRCFSVLIIK